MIVTADRWSFGGVDLSSYAYLVSAIGEADDLPPLRGDDLVVPYRAGAVWMPKVHGPRRFSLGLWVSSSPALGGDGTVDQAQANLDALRQLFALPGLRALVRTLPDGSTRTAMAEVVSFQVNEIVGRREGFVAVADFSLPDPHFYGGDIVTDRTIASSPHSFNLSNPGTVRTSKLAISATGPLSNLRLTQTATGIWVEALVTVPAGKVLVIDTDKATAVLDGTSVVQSIRHSGDVRWWLLEPGTNPITIESGTTGGQVSIVFAPAYL